MTTKEIIIIVAIPTVAFLCYIVPYTISYHVTKRYYEKQN